MALATSTLGKKIVSLDLGVVVCPAASVLLRGPRKITGFLFQLFDNVQNSLHVEAETRDPTVYYLDF